MKKKTHNTEERVEEEKLGKLIKARRTKTMRRRRRRREEFHPENRRKAKKKAIERRQEECERENLNEHSKITLEPLSFSHSFYLLIRLVDAIKQKGDIGLVMSETRGLRLWLWSRCDSDD
jgi:hypothetical protein